MENSERLAELVLESSPFPWIDKSRKLHSGAAIPHPRLCTTCTVRECVRGYDSGSKYKIWTCFRGLGFVALRVGSFEQVLNGILLPSQGSALPRKLKKELAPQMVQEGSITGWHSRATELVQGVEDLVDQTVETHLGMLHDVQTSVSSILRNTENFVDEQSGDSYEEKVENLPRAAKTLVKSVELLEDRLKMMPLLTNPESAAFGTKRPTRIYRSIDRTVRILRAVSAKTGVNIQLQGASFLAPRVYDSFSTIPLVLIENATKYSPPGQTVTVEINDERRSVFVKVRSFSPRIPEQDRDSLFNKGFRCEVSETVASRGSGLGLYLAKTVADAHGFRIRHAESGPFTKLNGIEYCTNDFTFLVPFPG
jgi:hypothetical protein